MPVLIKGSGGMVSDGIINFPLSIQPTQPTPIRSGHIWINSSTLASKITYMSIQESLWGGTPNNSLQFVVGETSYNYFYTQELRTLTSGGNSITTVNSQNNGGTQEWLVGKSSEPIMEYKLSRPMIYSKVDGILDIETSYLWNGSTWVLLCQKGNYLAMGEMTNSRFYNNNGNSLSFSSSISGYQNSYYGTFNGDGTYYVTLGGVIKRTGDVFTKYFDIPQTIIGTNSLRYVARATTISSDGSILGVGYYAFNSINTSNNYFYDLAIYRNNGNGFDLIKEVSIATYMTGSSDMILTANDNGTAIGIAYPNGGSRVGALTVAFINGSVISTKNVPVAPIGGYFASWNHIRCIFFYGGNIYAQAVANGGENYRNGIFRATIDFSSNVIQEAIFLLNIDRYPISVHDHTLNKTNGELYYTATYASELILTCYSISENKVYSTKVESYVYGNGLATNLEGNKIAIVTNYGSGSNQSHYLNYYNISKSGTAINLSKIQTITFGDISFFGLSMCPN